MSGRISDLLKRGIKYILLALIIALSTIWVPSQKLQTKEIFIIATIGAVAFAILDIYSKNY
jgi:hypothetical protein